MQGQWPQLSLLHVSNNFDLSFEDVLEVGSNRHAMRDCKFVGMLLTWVNQRRLDLALDCKFSGSDDLLIE